MAGTLGCSITRVRFLSKSAAPNVGFSNRTCWMAAHVVEKHHVAGEHVAPAEAKDGAAEHRFGAETRVIGKKALLLGVSALRLPLVASLPVSLRTDFMRDVAHGGNEASSGYE